MQGLANTFRLRGHLQALTNEGERRPREVGRIGLGRRYRRVQNEAWLQMERRVLGLVIEGAV